MGYFQLQIVICKHLIFYLIRKIKLNYLSHGKQITGGYLHEKHLAESLVLAFGKNDCEFKELRRWEYFNNFFAHINLFLWAFKNSSADITICVTRLGLAAILRNIFNKNKIVIVWHYYDNNDGKSLFLKLYYILLILIARAMPTDKLAIICVAPFWQKYFTATLKIKSVFHFPNFFNETIYATFKGTLKKKKIFLGQDSFKNDKEIFVLAERLFQSGYECYFSTNDASKAQIFENYSIKYFEKFEDYLNEMASSLYTLAFPKINEGWNRIAHESMLVGTQVIGLNKGGLGDLLTGANAIIVSRVSDALEVIHSQKQKEINTQFLEQFNLDQTEKYLFEIIQWCCEK